MKIAIFHNFLDNIGGAERLTLTLAKEIGADVITTVADRNKIKKLGFDIPIKTIGWIPVNAPWRQQLSSARFRLLNLQDSYDRFIIAGDWAVSGAVRNAPNIWYCNSPIRELWDFNAKIRQQLSPWKRPVFDVWATMNRGLNQSYIKHVDTLVTSSKTVQARARKYLNRDSTVIYPPVPTSAYRYEENGNFWLSVNRLFVHKRVDLQMEVFRKLPNEKLVIVGSYEKSRHFLEYVAYLKRIKSDNVELLHWIDDDQLIDLYARCKGLITTADHEDFGLTPVEAMASGKPVVAVNEGGYTETVIDGVTGRLVEVNEEALRDAVQEVGSRAQSYKEACLKQAKTFDTSVFIDGITRLL